MGDILNAEFFLFNLLSIILWSSVFFMFVMVVRRLFPAFVRIWVSRPSHGDRLAGFVVPDQHMGRPPDAAWSGQHRRPGLARPRAQHGTRRRWTSPVLSSSRPRPQSQRDPARHPSGDILVLCIVPSWDRLQLSQTQKPDLTLLDLIQDKDSINNCKNRLHSLKLSTTHSQ